MSAITSFHGEYRFLSNFWPAPVLMDGDMYPTVEHAYVAAKTTDRAVREAIRITEKPGDVKRFGRALVLREDWEDVKLPIMNDLVWLKFLNNVDVKAKLLATGDAELIEGNTWNDTFWGMCKGQGENHLGRILMNVREHLR